MRVGKLTGEELKENVLSKLTSRRNEVIIGPAIAEDSAVIRTVTGLVFVSGDPITGAVKNVGTLAVHINCNDIAASGAEPVGILVNLLLPESGSLEDVADIMTQVEEAAKALRIDVLGGHTEFTNAVNTPVVMGTAVGLGRKAVKSKTMEPGDSVVMTKTAGIEGSMIIAGDYEGLLRSRFTEKLFLEDAEIAELRGLINDLSVLPESRIMVRHEVSAMHDITEGGVLGAVYEMCGAAGLGAEITLSKIPVLESTKKMCRLLKLDPHRLLSSGSMICTTKKPRPLINDLAAAGIPAAVIGKITEGGIYTFGKRGVVTELAYEKDEIGKLAEFAAPAPEAAAPAVTESAQTADAIEEE